jgi:CRISPR system Cascade subunit CasB
MNTRHAMPTTEAAPFGWWSALQHDPGARANLRRCRSAAEAATIPASIDLARRMGLGKGSAPERFAHACELARILAWIDGESRVGDGRRLTLMQVLGWPRFPDGHDAGDNRPRLSEVRFRRLLRTDDPADLAYQLVRLIRQADRTCRVQPLAEDFMAWCVPTRAAAVKQRWAYTYYNAQSEPTATVEDPTS